MKYIPFVVILFFATACNQITGTGHIASETRKVNSFSALKVSNSINVDVQQGSETSVIVEGDDNIIQFVKTNIESGTLKIYLEGNHNFRNTSINVHVIAPTFIGFEASSSADITSNGQITCTSNISVDASSSASINLNLDAPSVIISASSSADISIAGRTKEVTTKASSSADIDLYGLMAETANAEANSSGTINIFASIKLNATANSSGDINYTGGVKDVIRNVSSSGSVEPK